MEERKPHRFEMTTDLKLI